MLIAFDVSSQNHPRKRVIQVKGGKFILIGTYPFRTFFSVSSIFTPGGETWQVRALVCCGSFLTIMIFY